MADVVEGDDLRARGEARTSSTIGIIFVLALWLIEAAMVAQSYLRLREELPDVDVQIVGAGNTPYLVPTVFRAVHRRRGLRAALAEINRATTAGSVLLNGELVGEVITLGASGVVKEVRNRLAQIAGSGAG